MSDLSTEVKQLIIETLDLEDIEASDINDDEALFVDGLGLDSIDALELGVAIKKAYDVKIDGNTDDSKKHFYSVKTLCDFIASTRA
ncbi:MULTISPECIES: phosphopantetheine-binding protein [Pseudoalteromonas]|uniref:phosphopantetheine-binding protein n=1 Tax=Pseudoalteromonas TaxID=53246 RepID=UPI000B3C8C62|nr:MULTISPECIES: phosphopantetheine-binding protein [Pseudoalteromonas]MCK8105617.1 phosphopantetheine-binding protein [Pseudoalteromonas sp. 2CM41L]MCQ8878458.1 phosphopantetheine-binding protein [Pseudoalteromonas shioyasakiensis]MDN3377538.1 phosphopantetheine-binding protein [Pseudoalteromonas sp. APC 3893]MDN3385295.1 phosphopantetheine-binding protein [Pseudoalteromonas sp. APC 4017]OUS72239.1 acyl carrier protein [Pseudoalteromonas sp. A601]